MKRILIISFVLLISCNTSMSIINGTYQRKGADFFHSLKLKNVDSSFVLTKRYFEANPSCVGKWRKKGDTIFLTCNDENDIAVILSNSYMNKRNFKVIIKNKNKLQLDNVILKRENSLGY